MEQWNFFSDIKGSVICNNLHRIVACIRVAVKIWITRYSWRVFKRELIQVNMGKKFFEFHTKFKHLTCDFWFRCSSRNWLNLHQQKMGLNDSPQNWPFTPLASSNILNLKRNFRPRVCKVLRLLNKIRSLSEFFCDTHERAKRSCSCKPLHWKNQLNGF